MATHKAYIGGVIILVVFGVGCVGAFLFFCGTDYADYDEAPPKQAAAIEEVHSREAQKDERKDLSPDPAVESHDDHVAQEPALSGDAMISTGSAVFDDLLQAFEDTPNPGEALELLKDARARMDARLPEMAAIELIGFLDSGEDADTDLSFRVGIEGVLREHPSLRIAALDWLGDISPDDGFAYARTIFQTSDSADEWALSFRNYGRQIEPEGDAFFTNRVREFVTREEWRENPTPGYAEGFDAVVFNRQYQLMPLLGDLFNTSEKMRMLSGMVLDNLVRQNPEATIPQVIEKLDSFGDHSNLRATLIARADVRSEYQRELVESYLLDPSISSAEKETFAKHFPHSSGFHAHRLLTYDNVLPLETVARIDFKALAMIEQWKSDTRFNELRNALYKMEARVRPFVEDAYRGGMIDRSE